MKPITALSLFNGISGLHLALDRAEIPIKKIYYSEIDKFANKVTEHHYPNDIALGDVTKWGEWDIDWSSIDIVSAGFPCQAWSVAGKQLGDKDERGMLFWTTLDIIKKVLLHNPNAKFMLENVKMKKGFEQYITHHTEQALGYVEKILINSALVSAQNRNRYYWTNFKVQELPKDKGILLKDILETDVDEKYFYSEKALSYLDRTKINKRFSMFKDNLKSVCVTANFHKSLPYNVYVDRLKSNCILTNYGNMACVNYNKSQGQIVFHNDSVRRLTPLECEHLQTLPDNFTSMLSDTQRYKCIGNGWTTDVISHILKYAFDDEGTAIANN